MVWAGALQDGCHLGQGMREEAKGGKNDLFGDVRAEDIICCSCENAFCELVILENMTILKILMSISSAPKALRLLHSTAVKDSG